jgi:hypothetical protein
LTSKGFFGYFPGADVTLSHIMTSGYQFYAVFEFPEVAGVGIGKKK